MKIKKRFVIMTVIMLIAITFVFSINDLNEAIHSKDDHAASAINQMNPKLSSELMEVLAKAGTNDLIKVWVEFDEDEYENKTGKSICLLFDKYTRSGIDKVRKGAFTELLPEEIVAIISVVGTGVEPPVELAGRHHYLYWYIWELTPNMIKSIVSFPGLQKMTLYKETARISKASPVLTSYIAKVAQEYPTHRVKLLIDLVRQIDPETGAQSYSYETTSQVLQKYNAEIVNVLTAVGGVTAIAPTNPQLITELSVLDEIDSIQLSWVYRATG